jgi:hypothetical protein
VGEAVSAGDWTLVAVIAIGSVFLLFVTWTILRMGALADEKMERLRRWNERLDDKRLDDKRLDDKRRTQENERSKAYEPTDCQCYGGDQAVDQKDRLEPGVHPAQPGARRRTR